MRVYKNGIIGKDEMSRCFGQKFYVLLKKGKIICTIFSLSHEELGKINKILAKNVMNAKLTFIPTMSGPFNYDNRSGIEQDLAILPKMAKVNGTSATSKQIGNMSDFYTDKTSYVRSKQTGHNAITSSCEHSKYGSAKRAPVNCEQDELLALATTDCIINILEAGERYISSSFADKCTGIDFTHISDNIGYCRNAYNNAISNLSRTWKAAKRPQVKDAVDPNVIGIDHVELIAANTFFARKEEKIAVINRTSGKIIDGLSVMVTDSDFHRNARKLLTGIHLNVFDMKMNGYLEAEIAEEMGCNIRKIGRIMVKIRNTIEPIASDLSDYVQRQAGTPAYSW